MDAPRERTMPLVPEPFKTLCRSRQSVILRETPMAHTWARFCPILNIVQYREPLTEEKKTELDMRASRLSKGAVVNHIYGSSEFCWEVCAWRDAFGLMMDDEGLRMDKRPYEYVDQNDDGQGTVKMRIPDATLGLKTYDDYYLKRGYVCSVQDCKEDHSTKQPDKRLSQDRLKAMMHNPECGLVVDGVWGKTDLVFPFAVYEAKKRASSFGAAEDQIYHACMTYLAMLDDLVRNPDNVAEYQTEDSSRYQLFAFTSCGSYWEVYIAWKLCDSCHVETIWEGDVKIWPKAFELICIMDQVHDYAVNNHRPFVMKHLEAWHSRHEKLLEADDTALNDGTSEDMELSDSDGEESDSSDCDPNDFEAFTRPIKSRLRLLKWFDLKERSKEARGDKARQTREHNRKLRKLSRSRGIDNTPTKKKRRRGEPPKAEVTKSEEAPNRDGGRPSKTSTKSTRQTTKSTRITRSYTRLHAAESE
ncbi:hypothetical protein BGZ63DRAFT_467840 [Mariannaea sp. PMI_226]|nr:hypothetical protein BGZ63DRAFT_467840 [Mariannaea sp. PMI_226]